MKIAFVGTSHVVAIQQGWEIIKESYPNLDVSFFAAPRHLFPLFAVGNENTFGLQPSEKHSSDTLGKIEQINGRSSIDLSAYDHIFLVGIGWPVAMHLAPLLSCDIEGLRDTQSRRLISYDAYLAFLRQIVVRFLPPAGLIFEGGPIVHVLEKPHVPRAMLVDSPSLSALISDPTGLVISFDLVRDLHKSILENYGFKFVNQPTKTLDTTKCTISEYALGTARLNGQAHPENDYSHMNGQYGHAVLEQLFCDL